MTTASSQARRRGDPQGLFKGKVAIMSFDHWLIRDFPK
jgi:hypothetical protein